MLGRRSRRTLRALAEVILPTDVEAGIAPDVDGAVDFVDGVVAQMPRILRLAFPVGLLLLELGTWLWLPSLLPFSRLDRERRERYVRGWIHARWLLRRDLIKGVKGLCLLAFYSDPRVMEHLGYRPDAHARLVAAERLVRYAGEV
jgi:hypothetical protein